MIGYPEGSWAKLRQHRSSRGSIELSSRQVVEGCLDEGSTRTGKVFQQEPFFLDKLDDRKARAGSGLNGQLPPGDRHRADDAAAEDQPFERAADALADRAEAGFAEQASDFVE